VGTEAVYVLEHGQARVVARGSLGRPNGVLWSDQGLVISPFGASELYRLDKNGKKADVTKLPAGGLTGITQLGDTLYVTSWQSSSVYRGTLGGAFEVALADQSSPGDPALDTKRGRLLVPHFEENTVDAFDLR
jgi:sugar lactone lactonase YvrE